MSAHYLQKGYDKALKMEVNYNNFHKEPIWAVDFSLVVLCVVKMEWKWNFTQKFGKIYNVFEENATFI